MSFLKEHNQCRLQRNGEAVAFLKTILFEIWPYILGVTTTTTTTLHFGSDHNPCSRNSYLLMDGDNSILSVY